MRLIINFVFESYLFFVFCFFFGRDCLCLCEVSFTGVCPYFSISWSTEPSDPRNGSNFHVRRMTCNKTSQSESHQVGNDVSSWQLFGKKWREHRKAQDFAQLAWISPPFHARDLSLLHTLQSIFAWCLFQCRLFPDYLLSAELSAHETWQISIFISFTWSWRLDVICWWMRAFLERSVSSERFNRAHILFVEERSLFKQDWSYHCDTVTVLRILINAS